MSDQSSQHPEIDHVLELSRLVRPCTKCGIREADWSYMPGIEDFCDQCVPRGCACQEDPTEPCVEFHSLNQF